MEGAAALAVAALLLLPSELAGLRVVAVVTGSKIDPVAPGIFLQRA